MPAKQICPSCGKRIEADRTSCYRCGADISVVRERLADVPLLTVDTPPTGQLVTHQLGLVHGAVVLSRNVLKDAGAALKGVVGGELKSYTKLMAEARERACNEMGLSAADRGANAVLGVRMASSEIGGDAVELLAYGTAVVLETTVTDAT